MGGSQRSQSNLTISTSPAPRDQQHRLLLLCLFSFAQFVDICSITSVFAAVPSIARDLGLSSNQSVWLISAYQLAFAAFLLLSGRMSDVFQPKFTFNLGFGLLGVLSLTAGFVRNKIAFLVLRALSAAALTIPSALSLLVKLYPEPNAQARAVAAFGGSGPIGGILGIILGGVFTKVASWHWIFWFNAIIAIPIASVCLVLIPETPVEAKLRSARAKLEALDIAGVSILTVGIILFIFALTSGSTSGWKSPRVIAPLLISVLMLLAFFVYETKIPEDEAVLPPRIWRYPNFGVLFGLSLFPYFWWTAVFLELSTFWQDAVGWSPLITALHFVPFGVFSIATVILQIKVLQNNLKIKTLILLGGLLLVASNFLFPFASSGSRYWSFILPAFLLGTAGNGILYTNANIAIYKSTPTSQSGVVGAIFNSSLQLGGAIGNAIVTSIQANVDANESNPTGFRGRSAAFWLLLAVSFLEVGATALFYQEPDSVENTEQSQ